MKNKDTEKSHGSANETNKPNSNSNENDAQLFQILVIDVDTGKILTQFDVTSGKFIIESKDITFTR